MERRGFVFSCLSAVAGLFGVRKPETRRKYPVPCNQALVPIYHGASDVPHAWEWMPASAIPADGKDDVFVGWNRHDDGSLYARWAAKFPIDVFERLRKQASPLLQLDCGYSDGELLILLQADKAATTQIGTHAIRLTRDEFYKLVECVQKCGCMPEPEFTPQPGKRLFKLRIEVDGGETYGKAFALDEAASFQEWARVCNAQASGMKSVVMDAMRSITGRA